MGKTNSSYKMLVARGITTLDASAISRKQIEEFAKEFHIGEEVYIPKKIYGICKEGCNYTKGTVVAKYDKYMRISSGKYFFSVQYIDLYLYKINGNLNSKEGGNENDE